MEDYNIQVGQEVQLTTNSSFYKNIYESKVLKVNHSTLDIATPYYKGLHVPLNIGFILNLRIFTSQGVLDFTTEVVDRNISMHSVTVKLPIRMKDHPEIASAENSQSRCKFITVTSGKGGVGKTSFIINYAICLASLGKRVVLIDADLGMANIDVLLKVGCRHNIINIIDGSKQIQDIIVKAPGGIHLIVGGSGIQELASLSKTQFYRITNSFEYLEKNFDYVLIDTGAGLSKNVTNFIFSSDETIIVTTPEPHAITDAYSIIKVVLESDNDIDLKLLINKCDTSQEGKEVLSRILGVVRNFLNYAATPMGFMMEAKVVGKSIKEQVPLMLSYPNSDTARSIMSFAENEVYGMNDKPKGSAISGFVSRFKQMFASG